MPRRDWTREETLVALNVYCRTPFGRLHGRNPEIIQIAAALGRTPDALAMKCCNLAAFDTALAQRGLSKGSRLDEQIWNEFMAVPERVAFEAELAQANITHQEPRTEETVQWEDVAGLDRTALTKVRVNQHFFRSLILASYRAACAICELPFRPLLVASHIVPWSRDPSLRMNPHNGICLCVLHDRAYDTGLLQITPDYTIAFAPEIEVHANLPAIAAAFLAFSGRPIKLPDRWLPDRELLLRRL